MTVLLDANVLVALLVDDHVHHVAAENWLVGTRGNFATCPITQGSLMRLLIREGQPAATAQAVLSGTAADAQAGGRPGHSTTAATYDSTVDITAPAPRVLVIGLDPYRVPGPWDPKPVADAIEAGMARFAEHGVGAESCLVGLDGSDDVETVIAAALCARPWECVVIGGGVRKPDDQLELFEQVVNLVRRHAPGSAIAFNATPSDTFDAATRWIDIPS